MQHWIILELERAIRLDASLAALLLTARRLALLARGCLLGALRPRRL